jgi:hypothetical protein
MSLNALLANHQDVGQSLVPDYIKDAPKEVRTRIAALKKLQLKTVDIQADFYRRVHELETQFRARYDEVNKQVIRLNRRFSSPYLARSHHKWKLRAWRERS